MLAFTHLKIFSFFFKKQIFFICLLISFLIYTLGYRLFYVNLPKDLPLIFNNITLMLFLFLSITLLVSINNIIRTKYNQTQNTNIVNISILILENLECYVKEYYNLYYKLRIGHRGLKFFLLGTMEYNENIYLLCNITKIIPPIILLLDIFYFQNLSHFFISLILLIVPIIFRYILHSLDMYSKSDMKLLNE